MLPALNYLPNLNITCYKVDLYLDEHNENLILLLSWIFVPFVKISRQFL